MIGVRFAEIYCPIIRMQFALLASLKLVAVALRGVEMPIISGEVSLAL